MKLLKVGDVFRLTQNQMNQLKLKNDKDILYVVEETELTGGGTGHGPHDVYPDGHFVYARALDKEGNFTPTGRSVVFSQTGCFSHTLAAPIKVIRKMKRTFIDPKSEINVVNFYNELQQLIEKYSVKTKMRIYKNDSYWGWKEIENPKKFSASCEFFVNDESIIVDLENL